MKLSPLTHVQIGAILAMAFVLLGCEAPSSIASEQAPNPGVVVSSAALPELVTVTNLEVATTNLAENPTPAQPVKLSDKLEEVVKLAQSGVGDDVLLAFIQNSATPFEPTPEEIVYLTDLGISDVIVTALVNHRGTQVVPAATPVPEMPIATAPPAQQSVPAVAPPPTYNPEPAVVDGTVVPDGQYAPPVVQYVTPQPVVEYNYFYGSLSPYGTWAEVADYGWCWQPTVAVMHHGWAPYCDRGRWLSTDQGWYWQSDYSWGWAPFHYGRWFRHPVRGWCWRPDSVWAPAWVSWRYSDSYCGWAPLPPGAHYTAGVGFSYYGAHVGLSFGFGLGRDAWTFVPAHRFHDPDVWRHRLTARDVVNVYHHTRVINNYAVDRRHNIINRGLDRERVPGLVHTEPRKIEVRDLPARGGVGVRPDRLHQEGSDLVVYRRVPPASQNSRPPGAERGRVTAGDPRPRVEPSPVNSTPGYRAPSGTGGTGSSVVRGPVDMGPKQTTEPREVRNERTPQALTPGIVARNEPQPSKAFEVNRGAPATRSQPQVTTPSQITTRPAAPSFPQRQTVAPQPAPSTLPIARNEPSRNWSAPAQPRATQPVQIAPRSEPAPNPAYGRERPATSFRQIPNASPAWNPGLASQPNNNFQRPAVNSTPQMSAPSQPVYRQESRSAPIVAPQAPTYRPAPVQNIPAVRPVAPAAAPTYNPAPQRSYSAPVRSQPAPSYSAPAERSSTPQRTAPSPSRSTPRASSSSNERGSNRR